MSILSFQDLATYAAGVNLVPEAVAGAILKAELLAQGPRGACRPLSKQPFVETPHVGDNGIARLSRWPIDTDAEFKVETKYHTGLGYGVGNNLTDLWVELGDGEFTLDPDLGEVTICRYADHTNSAFSLYGGGRGVGYPGRFGQGRTRSSVGSRIARRPQAKITYTSGFDFQANPLSEMAQMIKTAVGCILALQNSCAAQGVKQQIYTDFESTTYGSEMALLTTSSMGTTPMEDVLLILKQFRPREYST